MKKILIAFACTVPSFAWGDVIISEFMYDALGTDSKQEWVELYNNGSSAIDITNWKINDGSNHTLNVPPKNGGLGSLSIPAQGYLVLASDASSFLTTHTAVNYSVIDTSLSLSNAGDTIKLLDGHGVSIDSVSYAHAGGAGDGSTLQWNGNAFIAGVPSPGSAYVPHVTTPQVQKKETKKVGSETMHVVPQYIKTTKVSKKKTHHVSSASEVNAPGYSEELPALEVVVIPTTTRTQTASIASAATSMPWWTGAGALSLLGGAFVFAAKRARRQEWDIEEIVEPE